MAGMRLLAIGEILWDVINGVETLGGAPLNFSAAVQRLGNSAFLLSGVGADQLGMRALNSMGSLGLPTDFVQVRQRSDTGTALVTTDNDGNTQFYIKRPSAFDEVEVTAERMLAIEALQPEWIYFGTLAQSNRSREEFLFRLSQKLPSAKYFYDINLRDGHWNLQLVERLSRLASIVKMNEAEAMQLSELTQPRRVFSLEELCRYWASKYDVKTNCVTLGNQGCAVFADDFLRYFHGYKVKVIDTVGAGDAFAAGFLHGFHSQWTIVESAAFANALGALVASLPGATPPWTVAECRRLILNRSNSQNDSSAD